MASQTDLDQGGTQRAWVPQWQGPSIGWIWAPRTNVLAIVTGGTYNVDLSTSLVTVNVPGSKGAVIINMPKATNPGYAGAGMAQPGLFANNPITIIDVGGQATGNPITINPAAGENIMFLSSIMITVDYGYYILQPNSSTQGWFS